MCMFAMLAASALTRTSSLIVLRSPPRRAHDCALSIVSLVARPSTAASRSISVVNSCTVPPTPRNTTSRCAISRLVCPSRRIE